jgi:predicted TIM-barrel fold metal-dependent hydrolase
MPLERTIPPPIRDPHPPTRFTPPPDATNGHCHVFGPADRFPFDPDRSYTPPDAGFDDFQRHQQRLGLTRAILVQASCHGTDNSALVNALRLGKGRYAGVALIDDSTTTDELAKFHDAGVRGIRFNFVEHLGGAPDPDFFWRQVERVVPMSWHIELHFDARDLSANADLFENLPVPFIIDAMGRVDATAGLDQEPFQYLLDMLRTDQRAWVKVSGAERITADGPPPYDDVVPYGRALIEAAPDRTLWGTDWPHPNVRHMPDDGDLIDLLADIAPDDTTRNRILVDNAERLYDFS